MGIGAGTRAGAGTSAGPRAKAKTEQEQGIAGRQ